MEEKLIGKITHYFGKIGVAVVEITDDSLKVGDQIHFKGGATDFNQTIESMQIDRAPVETAEAGQSIGLKTDQLVKVGDQVYKLVE